MKRFSKVWCLLGKCQYKKAPKAPKVLNLESISFADILASSPHSLPNCNLGDRMGEHIVRSFHINCTNSSILSRKYFYNLRHFLCLNERCIPSSSTRSPSPMDSSSELHFCPTVSIGKYCCNQCLLIRSATTWLSLHQHLLLISRLLKTSGGIWFSDLPSRK